MDNRTALEICIEGRNQSMNENIAKIKEVINIFNNDNLEHIIKMEMALEDIRRLWYAKQQMRQFVDFVDRQSLKG